MVLDTTMMSLWCNFSGNVSANSNWSCLLLFLLRKFIEDRNRLLPDEAADSARCTGLCARCTRTVCKWFRRSKSLTKNLNPMQWHADVVSGSGVRSFFKSFIRSHQQFLNKKSHWRNTGKFSAEQSYPEFQKEVEMWRLVYIERLL